MQRIGPRLVFVTIFILAGITFFTGINWGLPSRDADQFLFGSRTPWTGEQVMSLAGPWDQSAGRGADIAMHPLTDRTQPIVLNDTDAKRAEIVRRYRLYSCQPDEMITFRSLSGMKPARLQLDPKMYQYGGLWIYPIGALLKLSSLVHLVTLRTDLSFYLDHPDQFARFYLLARTYSALWGLLGIWVVYRIGKEWAGNELAGLTSAALFASMPVVIDLAHEAKPHLAGTVLALITGLTALRYIRTGYRRWWILAGIFAGAAMGMVLTGYAAFALLPVMAIVRKNSLNQRIKVTCLAGLLGVAVFALTNPFLPLNLIFHRQLLHSNVGNYGSFYQPKVSFAGCITTIRCVINGMSPAPAALGLLAILILPISRRLQPGTGPAPVSPLRLLLAPAIVVLMQMLLLADGKTAEFARFALFLDVVLALAAAALIASLELKPREKQWLALLLVGGTLFIGARYDRNFLLDSREHSTRQTAANILDTCSQNAATLAVFAEPAPYCLPPVNLFTWRIILQPPSVNITALDSGTIAVRPVDLPLPPSKGFCQYKALADDAPPLSSPISWANKPFEILGPSRHSVSSSTNRP